MYRLILYTLTIFVTVPAERVQYMSTEHPAVTYYNTKYVSYVNLTARRYGRSDPFYYVDLNFHTVTPFGNNVVMNFYFYEFLSNVYKRSFVEMHFGVCDLIEKDMIFGSALRQGKLKSLPCPYAPGTYNLYNMSIPVQHVPRNFPFKKGRIYCNITRAEDNELMANVYIDMEIKWIHIRKKPATLK